MKIRIGSRKSDLAQIQSRVVAAQLKKLNPNLSIEFVVKDVGVDLNHNISLVDAETQGLFTKDLSQDLIRGQVDMVVHSWKDLPTTPNPETLVAATLEREDPRDIIFFKKHRLTTKELALLSSSPRRSHNINNFLKTYVYPDRYFNFLPIRGNLPTRMEKFLEGEEAGLVLALAAVKRLLVHGSEVSKTVLNEVIRISRILVVPILENPCAPAQGALAIEIKKDRADLAALLEKINHKATFFEVTCERERLKEFGGGCHLKLGIYQKNARDGVLRVEKGISPDSKRLSLVSWQIGREVPKIPAGKYFDASKLKIFDRRPNNLLRVKFLKHFLPYHFMVAKAEAIPDASWIGENDVIWAAGLETWKKLREKDYWVSGSNEGMGENFQSIPMELWPEHTRIKLSHSSAPKGKFELVPTYDLKRNKEKIPDLNAFDFFFWPSGSLFLECLKEYPKIKSKTHFCGLGNTYTELKKHVAPERVFAVVDKNAIRESLPSS
jgi:hydroxymethylbilane synthase